MLRDFLRDVKKQDRLEVQGNVIKQAQYYLDLLEQNPHLTKSQLAKELGVSRIRVYMMLNILKLAPSILDFIQNNDTTQYGKFLTERRLRPLTKLKDPKVQINRFREILIDFNKSAR